jgi:hypothetical protein
MEADIAVSNANNQKLQQHMRRLHAEFWYLRDWVQKKQAAEKTIDQERRADDSSALLRNSRLSIFDGSDGTDGWSRDPETLLPLIFTAWDELQVPLLYRSRFYLDFSNKNEDDKMFFYRMEKEKLELRKRMVCNRIEGYVVLWGLKVFTL